MEKESRAKELWIEKLEAQSPRTGIRYMMVLDRFLEFTKIESLEKLYQLKAKDEKTKDKREATRMESLVKSFLQSELKRGLKAGTVRNEYKAIISFFKSQNMNLKLTTRDLPQAESQGRRLITKSEILSLYDSVGSENKLRNRALALTLKDSGLRIQDTLNLNIENFTKAQIFKVKDEEFRVFDPSLTAKCGVVAYMVLGPESVKALKEYLESRKEAKDEDPLFLDARHNKRLSGTAGVEEFRRLASHVKNGSRLGAHSFRKFYITSLIAGGLPEIWVKKLVGKKAGGAMDEYNHPEEFPAKNNHDLPNLLVESYIEHYENLAIFGAGVQSQIDELKAIIKSRDEFILSVGGIKPGAVKVVSTSTQTPEPTLTITQSELMKLINEAIEKKKAGAQ